MESKPELCSQRPAMKCQLHASKWTHMCPPTCRVEELGRGEL